MRTAHSVYNGYAPAEGPKALPLNLDFSTLAEYAIDFQLEETTGQFQFAQGVYVDNSLNTNPLVILVSVTGQRLVVPAGAQMTAPIFAIDQTQVRISTTPDADLMVQVIFLNVPTAYNSWGPITVNLPGVVVTTEPYTATEDDSGTVVAGLVSAPLVAANLARKGLIISADPTNFAPVTVTLGGVPFAEILPGQTWQSGAWAPSEALDVISTAAAQNISFIEFV